MKIVNAYLNMWVELDKNQIFPNDPGQGTPVLVCLKTGETATWNCVAHEEEVDGAQLNARQVNWLHSITSQVEQWMQENGA